MKISTIQSGYKKLTHHRFTPIWTLALLVIFVSFFTRAALLIHSAPQFDWGVKNVSGTFAIGLFYDLAMCAYLMIPLVLQLWLTNEKMYQPKWRWLVFSGYAVVLSLLFFTNLVPADFNKGLKNAVAAYIFLRFLIFTFLMFRDAPFRKKWRTAVLYVDFFLLT